MAENKAPPHWIVRLFMGLTFAGLMATVMTYILPVLIGGDGGYTRTAAIAITVFALLGVLVTSAVLQKRGPKE
jgi:VIT1/CCC1 family predicted Fe2+/Mn2+ transporter